MKRGEIWTVAGGGSYAGKPRPVAIIQASRFDATRSITICAFTSNETEAQFFRVPIAPNAENGLRQPSRLMVDKIFTVPREKLGRRIGCLDREDVVRLDRTIMVFLGLAGGSPA